MHGYRGKRALDLVVAVPALILSLPVQAVVALLVRRRLGSPVLFRQHRPGLDGKLFRLLKFRTMYDVDPALGRTSNESRHTLFGANLRSTSLDELPSLLNVVKGDMSLVGPRPLLPEYLPLYSERQMRRHEVRPGVTGLAQVAGRNELAWEGRFDLDVEYVDTCSLRLDLKVLLMTLRRVLCREGVTPKNAAVVTPFAGTVEQ